MQVTHTDDHITHAVIGGGQTIDFGISNNAEFFHILSSTLYTNQELAVVREVLCNAWDAHIEAERKAAAVELLAFKKTAKVSWVTLGLPDTAGTDLTKLLG